MKSEDDAASRGAAGERIARTLSALQPRTLRRNAAAAVVRWVVTVLVMAAVFPVMLARLGTETFGLWAVLTTPTSMAALAGLGVAPACVVLLGRAIAAVTTSGSDAESGFREAGRLCGATMLLSAGAALLTLVVGWLLTVPVLELLDVSTAAADARLLFRAAVVCLAVMLLGSGLTAQLEAARRVDLSSLSWAVISVLNALFLLIAVLVQPSLRSLAYVQLVTAVLNLGIPLLLLVSSGLIRLWTWMTLERSALRSIATLGISLGGAGALIAIVDPLVKLTLGSIAGLTPVAAYELAQRLVRLAGGMFSSALQPLFAHVSGAVGSGQITGVPVTVGRTLRAVSSLSLPVLTGLALSAPALIGLWLGGDAPEATALSIGLLCPGMAANLLATPAYHALQGAGHGVRALSVQVATLLALSLFLVLVAAGLVPGSYGGALATAVGWLVGAAVTVVQYGGVYGRASAVVWLKALVRGLALAALVAPWSLAAYLLQLSDLAIMLLTAVGVLVAVGAALAGRRRWRVGSA